MNYIQKEFTGNEKKATILVWQVKIFLHNPSHSYDRYDIIVSEIHTHIFKRFICLRYGKITFVNII